MKGLNRAGFSDKEYRIGSDMPSSQVEPEPAQQHIDDLPADQDSDAGEFTGFNKSDVRERLQAGAQASTSSTAVNDAVTEMARQAEEQGAAFEAETQKAEDMRIPLMEGGDMRRYYDMQTEFSDAAELRLPVFVEDVGASLLFAHTQAPVSRELLADGFTLADKDMQINFDMSQADIAMLDVDAGKSIRPRQITLSERDTQAFKTLVQSVPPEKRKELCIQKIISILNKLDFVGASDLSAYVKRIVDQMSADQLSQMEGAIPAYAKQIRKKIESLADTYREKKFFSMIEADEIKVEPMYALPKVISPVVTMLPISKSLYTDEADVNDFEYRVISAIAGLPNIRW